MSLAHVLNVMFGVDELVDMSLRMKDGDLSVICTVDACVDTLSHGLVKVELECEVVKRPGDWSITAWFGSTAGLGDEIDCPSHRLPWSCDGGEASVLGDGCDLAVPTDVCDSVERTACSVEVWCPGIPNVAGFDHLSDTVGSSHGTWVLIMVGVCSNRALRLPSCK